MFSLAAKTANQKLWQNDMTNIYLYRLQRNIMLEGYTGRASKVITRKCQTLTTLRVASISRCQGWGGVLGDLVDMPTTHRWMWHGSRKHNNIILTTCTVRRTFYPKWHTRGGLNLQLLDLQSYQGYQVSTKVQREINWFGAGTLNLKTPMCL